VFSTVINCCKLIMSFQIKTILFQQILFFFILSYFLSSLLLQNFEIQSSVQNLQPAHYIRAVLYPEDKNCCIPFCRTYYLSGRQYLSKRQIYIRLTVKCSFYTVFIFFFLQIFCSSTSLFSYIYLSWFCASKKRKGISLSVSLFLSDGR
jgi:hypothetical protein